MTDAWAMARAHMVADLEVLGIRDPGVLAAMRRVPRHAFVPEPERPRAYQDRALPLAAGQTISQPYIVARMTELAALEPTSRVLEIGTGSGYQAAILAELAAEVYTIELTAELAAAARIRLDALGYGRVHSRHGDGRLGWPEAAPFDAILVTAAAAEIPPALPGQLAIGGRLVIPVGELFQELELVIRTDRGLVEREIIPVEFVPLRHG